VRHLDAAREEIRVFEDESLLDDIADTYAYLAERARLVDEAFLRGKLREPGTVIFEGAQGVLLDAHYGFAPYTTWSNITFDNALALLDECAYAGEVTRLGVLRTTFTRHGAGPFVTEDATLAPYVPEPHNANSAWQQGFRVGWFDAVAARYALDAAGGADALAITHVDRLPDLPAWKLCEAYEYDGDPAALDGFFAHAERRVTGIGVLRPPSWEHQERLTERLMRCQPRYTELPRTAGVEAYLSALEAALDVPVTLTSSGQTAREKAARQPVGA
jgi:adenylosuccinate synthase